MTDGAGGDGRARAAGSSGSRPSSSAVSNEEFANHLNL